MGDLTGTEMENEVRFNLGNRTDLNDQLYRYLNMAQKQIARASLFPELFTLQEDALTVVGTPATDKFLDLSSYNIRGIISFIIVDSTRSRKVVYKDPQTWDKYVPYPEDYTTGRPDIYTYYQKKIEMYRIPDIAYEYKLRLLLYPTDFVDGSAVVSDLDNKDDAILAMATAWAFRRLGMEDKADTWAKTGAIIINAAKKEVASQPDFDMVPPQVGTSGIVSDYWADPFITRVR